MYSYKTGLGQVWVGSKLPPDPANNIIWLRPSDDHRVLWEIRTYNIYKERWEVLTSAALTAEGLLVLIRDLEKDVKSLQELKVVLYDTVQDLTPEQQQIARQNIGAISLEDLPPQVEVVQEVGSSTTAVMSQNAVTEELSKKASPESVTESISVHNTSTIAHADIRELLNTCVGLPAYDSSSYKITFTTLAGATVEIDLPIEQLALRYNAETESIEFDNADGTTTSIPVSAFVKEYVGSIGDRIQVSIDENNVIHATILKNSIDWDCLSFELQGRINDHVTSADFATKAVRTDITQTLTTAQQAQAFNNLGWKVHVISESAIGSSDAVSDDEKAARLSATALLVKETGIVYNFAVEAGGVRRFYGLFTNSQCSCLSVTVSSGAITIASPWLHDQDAVSFTRNQSSISDTNKNRALGNIGIDLVRLPYSLLGTTLSDEMVNVINNARGIILVNTPSDYMNPTVFVKGNNVSGSCIFVSFIAGTTYCQIELNKSTKVLSGISSGLTYGGSVRYSEDQNLTNTQKDTVLSNIGLNWIHVPYSLLGTTLDDDTYTKLTNAYGIILTDAPSEYHGPLEFICGANNEDGTKVFSGFNLANTSAYIVLRVNHNITNVSYLRTYEGAVPYDASVTLTSAQQAVARTNIKAVGSSMIKGVEIVYGAAPMQEDNILYIELEETT